MIYPLRSNHSFLNEQGFGLLSIVFMILTISVAAVTIMTVINPSSLVQHNQETVEKARVLRAAIQSYQSSHGGASGSYPASLDSLVTTDGVACAIDNTPTSTSYLYLQGWCGPYVDQVFQQDSADFKKDGWGTLFSYTAGTSVITSCGPDKTCGGADDLTFSP